MHTQTNMTRPLSTRLYLPTPSKILAYSIKNTRRKLTSFHHRATIEDQPPVNMLNLPTVARAWFLASGIMWMICGFVFIGELFNGLAVSTCPQKIGSGLCWGSWTGGTGDGLNARWREVFPLSPSKLLRIWTAVFMGFITIICHLPGFKYTFIAKSWFHVTAWLLFGILFAAFPYAGNLGILFGFFCIPGVFLALFTQFSQYRNENTSFHFHVNHIHLGCLVDNELFLTTARVMCLVSGLATMLIGFIHVFVVSLGRFALTLKKN